MKPRTDSGLIPVDIFGQTYNVRGEDDQGYIEELARYVDTKMKTISEATRTVDPLRVAILAALNLADELFKLERERQSIEREVATRATGLVSTLEETLREDAGGSNEPIEV